MGRDPSEEGASTTVGADLRLNSLSGCVCGIARRTSFNCFLRIRFKGLPSWANHLGRLFTNFCGRTDRPIYRTAFVSKLAEVLLALAAPAAVNLALFWASS
jgi:hypothetical protein